MVETAKEKPYILLVDDHPHNLVALEAVLGTSEYHLVSASSGLEALAILNAYDFALVLLDIHMPEMDGYEVAKQIKASPKSAHIPIFLVTAVYREDPYVQRAYEVGAVEYFSKPFNPDVLRAKVSIYAELYSKNVILRRKEEEHKRYSAELRTVMETVSDAIYVGDEKGITRCNSAALEMFGLKIDETTRITFETLAERLEMRYPESKELIPISDQPFAHALRGEQYVSQVLIRHASSGSETLIGCAAAPVVFEKRIIGAVVINSGHSD